jgi:Undecaprenyl-phosphate glucose phosphotransferase
MIRRLNIYVFYMRLVCNLLPLAAFAVAEYVRFLGPHRFDTLEYDPRAYFQLLIFATVVWSISADHYRLASPDALLLASTEPRRTLSACCATYAVLFVTLFFYREVSFSRVFLVISAASLLLAGIAFQAACRRFARRATLARNAIRLLIVGADAYAADIAARLRAAGPACQVLAYVALPGQEIGVVGSQVYSLDEMGGFAVGDSIEEVVIAVPPARWHEIPAVIPALEPLGTPIRAVLDIGQGPIARDQLFHFGSLNLLDLGTTPLDRVSYLLFKRVMDVLLSVIALVLAAPLLLLIAAAIRLTSPGPVLFVQDRVGLNGKTFRMYKFRTMRVTSLAESETSWTTQNDCRRTGLGTFLRRHSLDELPQFFNVLRGDMSLVGPRPERPHFVRKFLRELAPYNSRHRLKVGMTGWAQVNGLRGDTSIARRVEYDLYYLHNWSIGLDLRILAMTFWTELFGDNAY